MTSHLNKGRLIALSNSFKSVLELENMKIIVIMSHITKIL